jgi:hypothetical protein
MNQAHRRERFRGCSNPRCRICHRWMEPEPEERESLAGLLLGGAGIVLLLIALAVILPLLPGLP